MPVKAPLCLDLSRLASRAGRVLTGVDRVERAYLRHFLETDRDVFALVRTRLGYLLLDREGMEAFAGALDEPFGFNEAPLAFLRKCSMARVPKPTLRLMVQRRLPRDIHYFNVGHSNLTHRTLRAFPRERVTVLIHDTIPLDLPDLQREGTPQRFRRKFDATIRGAGRILCISRGTRDAVVAHAEPGEWNGELAVAPIGVDLAIPAEGEIPDGLDTSKPFFVVLGTIEPRKNHALLLDIWDDLGSDGPVLFICGQRGWRNEEVFARLDEASVMGRTVFECSGLSDGAVAALLEQSRGLLFPSLAEGFGLPAFEAAGRGVPVVCGHLPTVEEYLGTLPIYVDIADRDRWRSVIEGLAHCSDDDRPEPIVPPSWGDHFKIALSGI